MTEKPLDVRRTADGRRRINLTRDERADLVRQERVEAAVALFLDITTHRTTQQIAEELGITRKQLKALTHQQDFIDLYNEHFIELGHDPRLQAVRAGLADLLPHAFDQMSYLLINEDTPASVRLKAVLKVMELNGVRPQDPKGSNKRELAEFLKDAGATLIGTQINYNVPTEYDEALGEVIEGVITEVEPTPLIELGTDIGADASADDNPDPEPRPLDEEM